MSKRIEQSVKVLEMVMNYVNAQVNSDPEGVSRADFKEMCRDAFKAAAGDFGVSESTIRDKVTRQLDINTETFYDELWDLLLGGQKLKSRLHGKACDLGDDKLIEQL